MDRFTVQVDEANAALHHQGDLLPRTLRWKGDDKIMYLHWIQICTIYGKLIVQETIFWPLKSLCKQMTSVFF